MNTEYRIWHIPQVPMEPFYVNCPDLPTADLVVDTLAEYDQFQFDHHIKPDYSNASASKNSSTASGPK